ncbi:mechanosensitive ion channel domain-containing protein [Bremerella sp. T1]|uniref:mechanosensitive ion channel domain-containing protein n=1 Tax=Bremerella sp. TYQ1 TaxID=3119568 RepID=UPI001CCB5D5A|nr:mechanosensitive ion channel domain-containing protein [Bremerella volcania]UBM37619.1 mechanosensitive ion channel [Bremerella volcania]
MAFRSWIWGLMLLAMVVSPAFAQDEKPAEKEYVPITTIDPKVPIDQLRIMVKPLTKQELEGEAKAWFKLLTTKSRQIAAVQLGVKKTNEAMVAGDEEAAKSSLQQAQQVKEKAEEKAKQAEKEITNAAQDELGLDAKTPPEENPAEEPDAEAPPEEEAAPEDPAAEQPAAPKAVEEAVTKKGELLQDVSLLQDERTALSDRLEVVLVSLERKGGEVEEYRKYIIAVSGFDVDTTDATATWAAVVGWIVSKEGGQRLAWNIAKFLAILLVSWIIAKFIQNIVNWLLERKLRLSRLAENLISRTIKNIVLVIGFAISLTALEIDITPIIAAIGATGLVVGLALQGTLSNFASGLMILVNRPFDVGDVVTAGGITGVIDQMNLVSTRFKTFDNQTIHVPNNEIWNNVITNITANHTRRVDLEFGISYDDDFYKAEEIIMSVVNDHELVLKKPEPQVVTHDLGESSVNIVCRPWARTENWWQVKTDITREVKRRFDEAGISIPYPQQDVHFYTNTNGAPPMQQEG